ncbi:hypothetical protein [Cryobacterium sp. Y62]|uniref:hypothetical protein n=1 Tax=Cryobacterium sp. Y62 TaxID=2048284 RepID=UPI000CE3FD17|nr:hypothetical protein [Cryobacterium sp. Y62]
MVIQTVAGNNATKPAVIWLLIVCLFLSLTIASGLLIATMPLQASDFSAYFGFFIRWASYGLIFWVVAVSGGLLALFAAKSLNVGEQRRRASFASGIAASTLLVDFAFLALGLTIVPVAAAGVMLAAVVAGAGYLAFREQTLNA